MGEKFNRATVVNAFSYLKFRLSSISLHSDQFKRVLRYGMFIYIFLLFSSLLFAFTSSFNLLLNPISDLGSSISTPTPLLFDFACIFAGLICIPMTFILSKKIGLEDKSKVKRILATIGLIVGIMGAFGYVLVGIFSLDRAGPNYMFHIISAGLAFGGFVSSIIIFSCIILTFQTGIKKSFGAYGLFGPLISLFLWLFIASAFFEWMLLFSIYGFSVPVNFITLKS